MRSARHGCEITGGVKDAKANALVDAANDRTQECAQFGGAICNERLRRHLAIVQRCAKYAIEILGKLALGDRRAVQGNGLAVMVIAGQKTRIGMGQFRPGYSSSETRYRWETR